MDDILLTDQIHRAYQFHALKIRTVQLWHHSLHLGTVKHSHQNRLNHIVVMMSQSDLVAAQFLSSAVKIASAHPGTKITGRTFFILHNIKNF